MSIVDGPAWEKDFPPLSYPDNNPKTAIGVTKVPLNLAPPSALHYLAMAFKDGAAKYGAYNWRDKTVSASVYYAAALRHLSAWFDGEDLSPDAGVHHLAHVMACCAIVLDAKDIGKLNDDRPTRGASAAIQAGYALPRYGELIPHELARAAQRDGVVFERVEECGVITGDMPPVPFLDDDEGRTPAEAPREHAP